MSDVRALVAGIAVVPSLAAAKLESSSPPAPLPPEDEFTRKLNIWSDALRKLFGNGGES